MKRKVVFLDRDGVINVERGKHTGKKEDFKIINDLFKSLLILKNKGYSFIIISNQSGIYQSLYTLEDVYVLNAILKKEFSKHELTLHEIYICPHHESISMCLCRKPKSLLFEKAIARFEVDIESSFMIGDKSRDIVAAENCGLKGFLIQSNCSILSIAEKV